MMMMVMMKMRTAQLMFGYGIMMMVKRIMTSSIVINN